MGVWGGGSMLEGGAVQGEVGRGGDGGESGIETMEGETIGEFDVVMEVPA